MTSYITCRKYKYKEGDSKASAKMVRNLLRLDIPEDTVSPAINKKFPFPKEDTVNINGTEELVNLFNLIDDKKFDLVYELSNIEHIGFKDKEIRLQFNYPDVEPINAKGIYSFTDTFFDSMFHMKKFGKYCLKNGFTDLLNKNIKELISLNSDKKRQYRIIEYNQEFLLRGLTSLRYKNYDNHIALYLSILTMHKYSEKTGIEVYVKNAILSDSHIEVVFQQKEAIKIPNIGELTVGVRVSNNEIREGSLCMNVIYSLSDENNNMFRASLNDSLINIKHDSKVETIELELQSVDQLQQYVDNIISLIQSIKSMNKLDQDEIYSIFSRFKHASKSLSTATRKSIGNIHNQHLLGNSYSIMEVFGKIDALDTDNDERLYLERVFNEYLMKYAE